MFKLLVHILYLQNRSFSKYLIKVSKKRGLTKIMDETMVEKKRLIILKKTITIILKISIYYSILSLHNAFPY